MSSFQSYETHGEILDWAYGCLGGLSYTAEISSSSSQIQVTFERNQAGMNIFLDLANEGLHGTVTDAQTGEPLYAAVWISGDPIPAYTDPAIGDLHRIVPPGIYDLTVWANGYLPQTINDVQVLYGTPGQFSASLEPGGGEYAFMVNSVNQHDPNNVWNNVTFPARALRAPDNLPCSLGSYGFIILDMGAGHEIVDGPGDDFTITEAIFPRDTHPERYHVYAGDPYLPNIWIGHGYGTTSFDLNGTGIDSVRYLRIISLYTASPNLPFAGFDLDAVTIINSAMTASLAISGELAMPEEIKVTAYPNPFNTKTLISFQLPTASEVSLKVYNLQGREVANLMDGRLSAGKHTAAFDGSQLASGVYFYVIKTGGFSISQKMLLIK
jgi:hypothetical protein